MDNFSFYRVSVSVCIKTAWEIIYKVCIKNCIRYSNIVNTHALDQTHGDVMKFDCSHRVFLSLIDKSKKIEQ